jgi:PmbA protein
MVEAIPTYNGEAQSVELYEQYNFGSFDECALVREIAGKMDEVKARYEAVTPEGEIACKVILNAQELAQLFSNIAYDLNYAAVYSHSNLFKKGDTIQKAPEGDLIGITMAGEVEGSVRSAKFDGDGMALNSIRLVESGKAANYFGSNRYGQYLGETPTGDLRCLCADPGTASAGDFANGPYLEVVSMSGLQVDFYNDYIGGEVRLAYYHDGGKITPVTGISISGSLTEVLNHIRLSSTTPVYNGYCGPEKAILDCMKIF